MKLILFQACNDPTAWPFARIARLAAAHRPDLVIHVGDYYYRETPCPLLLGGCAGSPSGDRESTWRAEFFAPAAPLLRAAPWVFVRGNHEDCRRGGAGWFRFLDGAEAVKACPAESDTATLDLPGLRLVIIDSSDLEDKTATAGGVAALRRRLALIPPARDAPTWMITHRPAWFAGRVGSLLTDGGMNQTERTALDAAAAVSLDLIVSGHAHLFESVTFDGGARPSQLVVGAGGDSLDASGGDGPLVKSMALAGQRAEVMTETRFGFLLLERQGDAWRGEFRDVDDRVQARCAIKRRSLRCRPVG